MMPSPKVGKSRFGHLNSVLNSALQSFSYPSNAAQLLGLKQQSLDRPEKQITGVYSFRYLNMPIEITRQQGIHRLDDESHGNESELQMAAHTQALSNSRGVLSYNNDQHSKAKGHRFDKETGIKSCMHNEDSDNLSPSENNLSVPIKHLQNHLSDTGGKRFLKDFQGENKGSYKELLQTNAKSEQNKAEHSSNSDLSFIGKNLQPELNNRQKINRDVNEEFGLGVESQRMGKQRVDAKNKAILNHQQLIQRYQAILEQDSAESHFSVDEKTRAAMQRMQEKLASVEESKEPQHKPVGTTINNKNIKSNYLNGHDERVFRVIQPLQQVSKNTSQTLPQKKNNVAKSHFDDSNKVVQIDHKLKDLTHQVEELNKTNLSYRKKIEHLESRQSKTSDDSSRGDSSTNSDSFWERNRLTHALIRMRT